MRRRRAMDAAPAEFETGDMMLYRVRSKIEHGIGRWPVPVLTVALLAGIAVGCWVKR